MADIIIYLTGLIISFIIIKFENNKRNKPGYTNIPIGFIVGSWAWVILWILYYCCVIIKKLIINGRKLYKK